MKKCKQCESEFPDSTKVCPECGNDVTKVANFEQLKLDKSTKKTLIISVCVFVLIIAGIGSCKSESSKAPISTSNPNVSTPKESPSTSQNETAAVKETAKNIAIALDGQIYSLVSNSEKATLLLQDSINLFSQGQITVIELYDLAKTAKETQFTLWSSASKLDDDKNKSYIEAVELYIVNNQQVAENLIKYLDKQELKYLSEAKSKLEGSSSYALSVVSERTNYLSGQGFSQSEIDEILSSSNPDS